MECEIINKLFLELSQIATAKTERESQLETLLRQVIKAWESETNGGKAISKDNQVIYKRAKKRINL